MAYRIGDDEQEGDENQYEKKNSRDWGSWGYDIEVEKRFKRSLKDAYAEV